MISSDPGQAAAAMCMPRRMTSRCMTPMRKGALGVERLNKILQQYLNPPDAGKNGEGARMACCSGQGDKVMQIKNNYQMEWEVQEQVRDPHG